MGVAELGTSGNPAADSCRVYNYYANTSNPTSCALPSQSTNNDGDVAGYYYVDNVNSSLSHSATYTYDAVNRLVSATATGSVAYSQTYTYTGDGSTGQYGNMSCTPAGPGCVAFAYSASTNRITTSGYSYDAAGDVTGDGTNTYQWDAEAHLIKVINGGGTAISINTYNALGQRVRDVTQSATTDEAYGAGGNLLWRYTGSSSTNRSFVPFSGGILAEYWSGGTIFDHPDEIGSATTSTDYTGNNLNEKLYYPFGESWTGAAIPNFNMHQTFAQLPDYDPETDQYNTANRHYSPSGRWMSPDPGGMSVIHPDNPQTWNLYAYVANNPTTTADPSGLDPTTAPSSSQENLEDAYDPDTELQAEEAQLAGINANGTADAAEQGAADVANESGLAQNQADPTTPPPPPTPDPAGTRTDPALNPEPSTNSNSSTTSSPADQTQAPMESRGQGKGERGQTSKPDNPTKGAQPVRDKNGKIVGWSIPSPDGKRTPKGLDWGRANGLDPSKFQTAAKIGVIGAIGAAGAYAISTAPEWAPFLVLVP